MLNKLELTKRIKKISSQLDGYLNTHTELPEEIYEIQQDIHSLQEEMVEKQPETVEEVIKQYQQHARDQFIQQSEFLKTLQNIQKNI